MNPTKSLFLTIDQGGHASRVIAYDCVGEIVASHSEDLTTQTPQAHFVEHDANQLLAAIRTCLQQVVGLLGDKARHIRAVGLATQRSNVTCWDKNTGEALSPIISWQDTRAHQWLAEQNLDREDIHKSTGLLPSAHYGASKLRWCLDNLPAVQQALKEERLCCGPMSSFLVHNLVQQKPLVADPVSASRTLLWHIHRQDWDEFLLSSFGIPREVLPKCVPTRYAYGDIIVNDQTLPLTVVTGDQSAAMYATGNLQFETAYINTGTGAFVSRPSGYALRYARRLLTSVIFSDQDESQYVMEGTVNGAGSAIEWLQQHQPVADLWQHLPDWLDTVTDPPLFLNGVSGLAAPYWVADFETDYSADAEAAANYVAVIESIVFLIHVNVQEMVKFASPPQQLQISGGLAKLDGLCQRLTDLTRLPIYRPIECEATTRGLAYLVAERPQHWPENTHGSWFKPRENVVLDGRFLLWEQAMLQRMRHDD